MNTWVIIIFPFLWLAVLCAAYFLHGKKLRKINIKMLLLYVLFMAMLGPVGEILVGTFYEWFFGQALWQYRLFPTHNAYTSLYAPVIWGIAGAHLYYVHGILRLFSGTSKWRQAAIRMLETIAVEAVLNVSFLLLSGSLIFYYSPGDLWHFTSLQTLPFYFILGLIVPLSIKRLKRDPLFYSVMCGSLAVVIVCLTN